MDKRSARLIKDLEALLFNLRNKDKDFIHRRLYRFFFNPKFYRNPISDELIGSLKNESYQARTNDAVERLLAEILENSFSNLFSPEVHSVNNKSVHTALTAIKRNFRHQDTFIFFDLAPVLKNLELSQLDLILQKRIQDQRLIRLIHKFIKNGALNLSTELSYSETLTGRPLGEILLEIIFLPLDNYLNSLGINWIRYRNALLIGINEGKNFFDLINKKIKSFYNVEVYSIKKRKGQKIRYLEYEIIFKQDNSVFLRIPQNKIKQFILKKGLVKDIDQKPWKSIHRSYLINLSDLEIFNIYNTELKKLYLYYSIANNVSQKLGQLKFIMETSCLKTLARKHKTTMNQIREKYEIRKSWGMNNIPFYKGFQKRLPSVSKNLDKISPIERNLKRRNS